MKLQEKEEKKDKANMGNFFWSLLTLNVKPFKSYVKGNHSAGKEFHFPSMQGNKLLT